MKTSASVYDDPPRKQVLLLTCMDLRLMDDVVSFMNGLNLQNRYDHLIFAGAAMGARLLPSSDPATGNSVGWKHVFFDHLGAAIKLLKRDIKDIFLLEHLDCGAYKELHPDSSIRNRYKRCTDWRQMETFHRKEARHFATEIRAHCRQQQAEWAKANDSSGENPWKGIRVRSFVMDLLGDVKEM